MYGESNGTITFDLDVGRSELRSFKCWCLIFQKGAAIKLGYIPSSTIKHY